MSSTARQLFFKDGEAKEATDAALSALAIAEKRYGPDHAVVAQALLGLAFFYVLQDQPEEAERHQKRALEITERPLAALPPEELKLVPDNPRPYEGSPAAGMALYYLHGGNYYVSFNRCAPALPLLERAVMWLEKAIGPDAYGPTEIGDRLGRCYIERGRYADAERHYKRAIAIGERHPDAAKGRLAEFQRMLAGLYTVQGYSDTPKAFSDRVGPPPAPTIEPYAQAGEHERAGRHAEAEALYLQELAKIEAAETKAIVALEQKLKAMGWSAEAIKERNMKSLARDLRYLPQTLPNDDHVARLRVALGGLYHRQRKFAEAEASLKHALALADALADDYPASSLATGIRLSLARLYADQGRYAKAEQAYTGVLATYEADDRRNRGKLPATRTAGLLRTLAQLARKQNQVELAEQHYKHILKILENLGTDRFDVARNLDELADLYLAQNRHAEAEPLLRRALTICAKGDMSPNHELVRNVLTSLAALYTGQGRSDDADKIRRGAFDVGQGP